MDFKNYIINNHSSRNTKMPLGSIRTPFTCIFFLPASRFLTIFPGRNISMDSRGRRRVEDSSCHRRSHAEATAAYSSIGREIEFPYVCEIARLSVDISWHHVISLHIHYKIAAYITSIVGTLINTALKKLNSKYWDTRLKTELTYFVELHVDTF